MNIFVEAFETVYRLVTFQTYRDEIGRHGGGPARRFPPQGHARRGRAEGR